MQSVVDQPAPDLGMDQLPARGIPEGRLCHIDFYDVGTALQLQLDGFPIPAKVAITVTGCQSDAIACAAVRRGSGSVVPGGYDHHKYLVQKCFLENTGNA